MIFSAVSLRLGKDIKDDTCTMVCFWGESVQYHNIRKVAGQQPPLVLYRHELVTISSDSTLGVGSCE